MAAFDELEAGLAAKFAALLPHLDERVRRLVLGAEARALGHGGIRAVARAAGVTPGTVSRGAAELDSGQDPLAGRVRRPGGGRKPLTATQPGLREALLALVEPDERGDPMSPLRWTVKSLRTLARELGRQGWKIGPDSVGHLLKAEGFSLQANAKVLEGSQHPDRNAQFHYLNERVKEHLDAGEPVISVDSKKKEMIGHFANPGRQWRPRDQAIGVSSHSFFTGPDTPVAIPYGIYDIAANTGWVNVGTDNNTATFAVESIRRWWTTCGRQTYPHATRLLITADAGGSNGYRTRAWKTELAALALATGLKITVCHLPPGTSKWNKIEHRLFSHITLNWRGRPLTSHDIVIQSIAATTTQTGLTVHATLDTNTYPTGTTITSEQVDTLPLHPHTFHGEWNYTLHPQPPTPRPEPTPTTQATPDPTRWPAHPDLTGMSPEQLTTLINNLSHIHAGQRALREQQRTTRYGRGPHPTALTTTAAIVVTILHMRRVTIDDVLADLYGVNRRTITRTITDLRPLIHQYGPTIPRAPKRYRTTAALTAHNPNTKIKQAC